MFDYELSQGQGFIPEDEWDQFISIMKEDLPATFRITGTRAMAEHVRQCLEMKFFRELSKLEVEGEKVPPPQPIPWYFDFLVCAMQFLEMLMHILVLCMVLTSVA